MKVGLVSGFIDLTSKYGIGVYTLNLIENLVLIGKANDLYLIHNRRHSEEVYTKIHDVIIPKPYLSTLLSEILGLPNVIEKTNIDIIHFSHHWFTYVAPFFLNPRVKKIVTIHDLINLLFIENYNNMHRLLWNSTIKLIKNRIDFVITVSEYTKKDCIKYLKIPAEKIKVIYPAYDKIYRPLSDKQKMREKLSKKYGITAPFILYVGTLNRRKNISVLIKAFYKLKNSINTNHKLVLVGAKAAKYSDVFGLIDALNLRKDIMIIQYIPKEDLVEFYNLADICVYPSIYEGFGLPPLEAMASGCPVITSNTSSLPEVVGDAGITFNPYNVDELTKMMCEVLMDRNLRNQLSQKGLERAKLFSWIKTAEETWKVYEEAYSEK